VRGAGYFTPSTQLIYISCLFLVAWCLSPRGRCMWDVAWCFPLVDYSGRHPAAAHTTTTWLSAGWETRCSIRLLLRLGSRPRGLELLHKLLTSSSCSLIVFIVFFSSFFLLPPCRLVFYDWPKVFFFGQHRGTLVWNVQSTWPPPTHGFRWKELFKMKFEDEGQAQRGGAHVHVGGEPVRNQASTPSHTARAPDQRTRCWM
jgi:hypothetical protein